MRTDVMTPDRPAQPGSHGGTGRSTAGGTQAAPDPDARRSPRPGRRSRPARPGSPVYPASPVRPASPIRPAGPGRPDRPGRTVRTVGPPKQLGADGRGQTSYSRVRPAGHAGQATAAGPVSARPVGRTFFIMLLLGLLGGGLVCLLVVNTTLAANSIQINRLEQANAARTQRIQELQQEVTAKQSAAVIAKEASSFGMRPEQVPAFLDLRTHSRTVSSGPAR
jgi:hypothetical protein